jgi:hypothetical protein
MVMSGIDWAALPPDSDYELSVYEMSTYNQITQLMTSPTGFGGANGGECLA